MNMNRLTVYDPFADVFPELMRGFLQPATRQGNGNQQVPPLSVRIDVHESDKEYVVKADLPGVAKEDIDIQIDGAQVAISAKVVKSSETREGERVLRSERYTGAMARSFTLGSEINEETASARYENGVLELTLPKKAAVAARRLSVN